MLKYQTFLIIFYYQAPWANAKKEKNKLLIKPDALVRGGEILINGSQSHINITMSFWLVRH